ncbi:MAG: V-type ATPase subunit [Coprobacillus sp.]|nr:V-type ATPase subunit [Coprobacillus sp.]CCY07702.1 v-type ATP synthase subunit C [Coprobacillus sp. CAG:698]
MNYPYANGIISVIENKVLDRNKLYVLSKYEKKEFIKVLLAMNYGGSGETLEDLIASENNRVKDLLKEISPKKEDTNLFYLVNDAQNIKILYKIKVYNLDKYDLLSENGTMDLEILSQAIIDNNFTNAPKRLKELVTKINSHLTDDINPKNLSSLIDNSIYSYAIKATNNHILKKYLTYRIDFNNVISMLRSKNLNWNKSEYFKMFLDNGSISKNVLENVYEASKEELIKCLEVFYDGKISKVLKKITSLDECQLEFERLMLELMKEYKNEPLNIGPVIYYYLLKQAEAQNIRILYSLDKVDIKDLL